MVDLAEVDQSTKSAPFSTTVDFAQILAPRGRQHRRQVWSSPKQGIKVRQHRSSKVVGASQKQFPLKPLSHFQPPCRRAKAHFCQAAITSPRTRSSLEKGVKARPSLARSILGAAQKQSSLNLLTSLQTPCRRVGKHAFRWHTVAVHRHRPPPEVPLSVCFSFVARGGLEFRTNL